MVIKYTLAPRPTCSLALSSFEDDLFYHFRTCAIPSFTTSLTPTRFWSTQIVPLAYSIEPIKYALCALGAAHKRFRLGYSGTPGDTFLPSQAMEAEAACIHQYNRAIQNIKAFSNSPSDQEKEVTLTCCVLFVCIENLLGRYAESLRHLQAGCSLLASFREQASSKAWQQTPKIHGGFLDEIIIMLYDLEQNICFFLGADPIPKMHLPLPSAIDRQNRTAPFHSGEEAAKELFQIDIEYERIVHCIEKEASGFHGGENASAMDSIRPFKLEGHQMFELAIMFQNWSVRFERFKMQTDENSAPREEVRRIKAMSLAKSVWEAVFSKSSVAEDMMPEMCEDILQRTEDVILWENCGSCPSFTAGSTVSFAIGMVFAESRSLSTKRRCAILMRSIKRREGIWDSREISDTMDAMIFAVEKGLLSLDMIPESLSEMAELAATLPLP